MNRALQVCVSLFMALASPTLAADGVDSTDVVKIQLEKEANTAALSFAKQLRNDPNTPILGNINGDVTLIKFSDYQCSFCKAAEPRIERLISEDPNVRVVVKEFPILGPVSVLAAKAALASRKQGKYAAYHATMMGYRGQMNEDVVFAAAAKVGLNVTQLKQDMNAPEIADQLIANFNLARSLKITLTPAYIVNATVLSGVSAKTSTAAIDFPSEVAAARTGRR